MINRRTRLKSKIFASKHIDNHWAISYGDMITLLLGFFVLFFNIKTDTVNIKLIQKNLLKKFSPTEINSRIDGPKVAEKKEISNPKIPIVSEYIKNDLKIRTNLQGEKLLIEFPDVSFFESGKTDITEEGKKALSDFASTISTDLGNVRFVIRGYTDNKPFFNKNGKIKDNLELSAFRSISAIRHLNLEGIPLNLLRIGGYAEANPIDRSTDLESRKRDRKISIVIEPLDAHEKTGKKNQIKSAKTAIENHKDIHIDGLAKRAIATVVVKQQTNPKNSFEWLEQQNWYLSYLEFLISIDYRFDKYKKNEVKK